MFFAIQVPIEALGLGHSQFLGEILSGLFKKLSNNANTPWARGNYRFNKRGGHS